MYPDAFRTELSDSLTAFYEKILKKVGAGGSPVGKALPREAEKIPVPVPVPSTEDAEEGHGEGEDPPPDLLAASQAAADGAAAPGSPAPPPTPPPKAAPTAKGGKPRKAGGGSACYKRACACIALHYRPSDRSELRQRIQQTSISMLGKKFSTSQYILVHTSMYCSKQSCSASVHPSMYQYIRVCFV